MTTTEANHFRVGGLIARLPETRHSPAGIAITRFVLAHHSPQQEAGLQREAQFRIEVVCTGQPLASQAASLQLDQRVQIEGFITRENFRDADRKLALHAQHIIEMDE